MKDVSEFEKKTGETYKLNSGMIHHKICVINVEMFGR